MGTKERRERERLEMRSAILRAARELAARHGWPVVSMRKIAEAIEYSPPLIYEYFADKDALLWALNEEGFVELARRLRPIAAESEEPQTALAKMALAYWDYAHQNPEMFNVMNGTDGAFLGMLDEQSKPMTMVETMQLVQSVLVRWGAQKGVSIPDLDGLFVSFWSAVNGMTALSLSHRIPFETARGRALVEKTVDALLHGWGVLLSTP